MRLQNGRIPRPECCGENIVLQNITDRLQHDFDSGYGEPMLCENLPTFPNNNNYSIVEQDIIRNDKIEMLYHQPNMWFHAFKCPTQDHVLLCPKSRQVIASLESFP